jgi:hypothetical protein
MKSKISIVLMVGFVVCLCSLTTLAQEVEQKDQLFLIDDYMVNPSMVEEFEAVIKESVALRTQHKFPYFFNTHSTEDFHYYFVWPMENYADIDSMYKAHEELLEKIGEEKVQALIKRFENTYEYFNPHMYYLIPERSYTPENPRLKPEEINYLRWDFYYLKPGKGEAFAENDKEWIALLKQKNIPDGYQIYVGDIGTDNPVVVLVTWGKDAVDYFTQRAKNYKILGEEAEVLGKKENALLRKYESRTGRPRPDLSYMPKEK